MTFTVPAPGPELARVLAATDPASLDRLDRLAYARAWDQLVRWTQAQALAAVAEVAGAKPRGADFVVDEIGMELSLSPGQAQAHVALARDLVGPRAATREALACGDISLAQAQLLSTELGKLPDDQALDIEKVLLREAPDLTRGQLLRSAQRAVVAANPDLARERRKTAVEERAAWMRPLGDGLSQISFVHTDEVVAQIWTNVEALADQGAGTKDQNRADAMAHLLTGGEMPAVQVVVHAERHDLGPVLGELLGSPLDPETLDRVARGGIIRWHDPHSPPPDTPGYRPTRPQDRWIRHEDRKCKGEGCPVDADDCDLHHVLPYREGGPTAVHNLITLCRHHHRLVHEGGWRLTMDRGRSVRWIAPEGGAHAGPP
jgi:hypothetical protein